MIRDCIKCEKAYEKGYEAAQEKAAAADKTRGYSLVDLRRCGNCVNLYHGNYGDKETYNLFCDVKGTEVNPKNSCGFWEYDEN